VLYMATHNLVNILGGVGPWGWRRGCVQRASGVEWGLTTCVRTCFLKRKSGVYWTVKVIQEAVYD